MHCSRRRASGSRTRTATHRRRNAQGKGHLGQAVRRAPPRRDPRHAASGALWTKRSERRGIPRLEIQPLVGSNGQAIGALGLMFRQNRTARKQRVHMVDLTTSLLISAMTQARLRHAASGSASRRSNTGARRCS